MGWSLEEQQPICYTRETARRSKFQHGPAHRPCVFRTSSSRRGHFTCVSFTAFAQKHMTNLGATASLFSALEEMQWEFSALRL